MKKNRFWHRFPFQTCKILLLTLCVILILALGGVNLGAQTASPTLPGQPTTGPGGADYKYGEVKTSTYGSGESQYWLFEPAAPTPESAPVVVFNHGYLGMDPTAYMGWINHLVRQGNIVIYPVYQQLLTSPAQVSDNAIAAVKNAIVTLKSGRHVTPELDKYAVVGHSAGGVISVNMAARAVAEGLPVPKAMMLVEASDGSNIIETDLLKADFENVPAGILMIAVAAADDDIAGSDFSENAILNTTKIPAADKNLVIMHSDSHGSPELIADHLAPLCPVETEDALTDMVMGMIGATTNVLDYYGFWKLFDGLTQTAFGNNASRKYAMGNTPEQRFMGLWSDGVPVKELEVIVGK